MDKLEQVQGRSMKMNKGLLHLSYIERLRELGLFIMEKAQGDVINLYQYTVWEE